MITCQASYMSVPLVGFRCKLHSGCCGRSLAVCTRRKCTISTWCERRHLPNPKDNHSSKAGTVADKTVGHQVRRDPQSKNETGPLCHRYRPWDPTSSDHYPIESITIEKKNYTISKFLKRYEERLKNVFQFTLEARVSFAIVLRIVLPANMELHSNLGFLFKYGKN
jgi:hypothetical protein